MFEHKEGLQLGHIQLQMHHNPFFTCACEWYKTIPLQQFYLMPVIFLSTVYMSHRCILKVAIPPPKPEKANIHALEEWSSLESGSMNYWTFFLFQEGITAFTEFDI